MPLFWSRKQEIEDKTDFRYEKIKNLIQLDFKKPNIQRDIIPERIEHLKNIFKKCFEPLVPLYICVLDNSYYIIDGQHRFEVFKTMKEHYNDKVPVCFIKVDDYKEIEDNFFIINDRMPLSEMWLQPYEIKHIIVETYNYFLEHYPKMFRLKKKRSICRPYIDKELFGKQLTIIFEDENKVMDIKTPNDLINKILALNSHYSGLQPEQFPAIPPTCNNDLINRLRSWSDNLHLGLVPDWHLHLIHGVPEDMTNTQQSLPKTQLFKLWKNYYGNCAETKCYVCNINDISLLNCHAGHIIARALGGKTTMDNIIPICAPCNLDMGTTNLYDYKNKNYTAK